LILRFKLDENADPRWREPLVEAGYTVSTIAEEDLRGADDEVVAEACHKGQRCLITADLDLGCSSTTSFGYWGGLRSERFRIAELASLLDFCTSSWLR
jgi:predicted nuclease of predicted toxin-antitoxin system